MEKRCVGGQSFGHCATSPAPAKLESWLWKTPAYIDSAEVRFVYHSGCFLVCGMAGGVILSLASGSKIFWAGPDGNPKAISQGVLERLRN